MKDPRWRWTQVFPIIVGVIVVAMLSLVVFDAVLIILANAFNFEMTVQRATLIWLIAIDIAFVAAEFQDS